MKTSSVRVAARDSRPARRSDHSASATPPAPAVGSRRVAAAPASVISDAACSGARIIDYFYVVAAALGVTWVIRRAGDAVKDGRPARDSSPLADLLLAGRLPAAQGGPYTSKLGAITGECSKTPAG